MVYIVLSIERNAPLTNSINESILLLIISIATSSPLRATSKLLLLMKRYLIASLNFDTRMELYLFHVLDLNVLSASVN